MTVYEEEEEEEEEREREREKGAVWSFCVES